MSPTLIRRLAWRDLIASPSLIWIVLAIAFGVAAIAAVGTARTAVLVAIERDAAKLLGGDLELEMPSVPLSAAELDELTPSGAVVSRTVRLNTLSRTDERRLTIGLNVVDGAYPLYGEVLLSDGLSLDEAFADRGVVVAPEVLPRLGVEIGDEIVIGDGTFTVRATLDSVPDRVGGFSSAIGPRVLLAAKDQDHAGVVKPGSVVRFADRFRLEEAGDAEQIAKLIRQDSPDARWQVRTASTAQPGVANAVERVTSYLTVAGVAALAIGGIGVALAARTHLQGKLKTMATLKALGAAPRAVQMLYGGQLLILGLIGTGLGLVLGAMLPLLLRSLPAAYLPVNLEIGIDPAALAAAAAMGLLTLMAFIWLPLAGARAAQPAALFRGGDLQLGRAKLSDRLIVGGLAAALIALVLARVDAPLIGLVILLSIAGGLAVLAVLAIGLQRLASRTANVVPPGYRLPLREIARVDGETTPVLVALGLGIALLALVGGAGHVIQGELAERVPDRAPSTVFIDLQPGDREAFSQTVTEHGGEILQLEPYLRGRLVRIDGVPVAEVDIGREAAWTVRRDRGLSFRDTAPPGAEIVDGEFWPADYDGPPLVMIEDEAVTGYGVTVGDTLSFNVLGRVITAEIAAVRSEIDWSRGRLDFLFLFSPGVLDAAPHTLLGAVAIDEAARPALLDNMAEVLPNATPLLVDEAINAAAQVISKLSLVVSLIAGVTLISGLIVLAASLEAVRSRQRYASAVLKALGARRRDLRRVFLVEHAALGLVASLSGAALGAVGSWALATFVLQLPWTPAWTTLASVIGGAISLTLITGLLRLERVVNQPSAVLLRQP